MYDRDDAEDPPDSPDDDGNGDVLSGWANGDIELADPSPTHLIINIETTDANAVTPVCPDCDAELFVETDGAQWDVRCDCDHTRRYHIGPAEDTDP